MIPPSPRPFPRFVADAAQAGLPEGEFEEQLTAAFVAACAPLADEAGEPLDAETLRWFPERGWGGRIYVPVSGRGVQPADDANEEDAEPPVEFYGHVSFVREGGDDGAAKATDLVTRADFTDITVDDNPEWDIDITDDVIGSWRGAPADGHSGDITLVWGTPMLPGGVIATAELGGELVDQASIVEGRFTLIAVDALQGFADPYYLDVIVWDTSLRRAVARESLYDAD